MEYGADLAQLDIKPAIKFPRSRQGRYSYTYAIARWCGLWDFIDWRACVARPEVCIGLAPCVCGLWPAAPVCVTVTARPGEAIGVKWPAIFQVPHHE